MRHGDAIPDAKTHLSAYLARLKGDERIILCKRNAPIAEIRLLPRHNAKRRPIGLAADTFSVPESFFEPLPEETLAACWSARRQPTVSPF